MCTKEIYRVTGSLLTVCLLLNINLSAAEEGSILINEFIVTPVSSEAIELCNPTNQAIDVGGWTISWGTNSTPINPNQIIPSKAYLIINNTNTENGIMLSNAGAILKIKDTGGKIIDQVGYGKSGGAPKPEYNYSTSRLPNCTDTNNDASNFNIDPNPTLNAENDSTSRSMLGSTTISINEIYTKDGQAFIEIFNSGSSDVDISGWHISVDSTYSWPQGTVVPAKKFQILEESDFPTYFSLDSEIDNVYLFDNFRNRIDQVGWASESKGSWNRIPDGSGIHDGWDETTVPLYDQNSSKNAYNRNIPIITPFLYLLL